MNKIARVIDANCNRTREGLRVIEEIARFFLDNKELFMLIKKLRHEFTGLEKDIRDQLSNPILERNSESDVGKIFVESLESKRTDILSVAESNCRRIEEALRVLEEFLKLVDKSNVEKIKQMRFNIYTIEKRLKDELAGK